MSGRDERTETEWICVRCGTHQPGNPRWCVRCGHTVYRPVYGRKRPVPGEAAREIEEGSTP